MAVSIFSLNDIAIYDDGSVEVLTIQEPAGRLPVVPYQLGMITQDTNAAQQFRCEVQVAPLQDHPLGTGKGATYIVSDAWVLYMARWMDRSAWNWWIAQENMLMLNRPSKWGSGPPSEMPAFECIGLPNNFIAFDQMTSTHGRVVGKSSTNFDTSQLNLLKNNWFYEPHLYWKATCQDIVTHEVRNVGANLSVYTPVIRQEPEQWCHLGRVELFPALPMMVTFEGERYFITDYCLQGASVYGRSGLYDVPLRLANIAGICEEPTEWHMRTRPVPAEIRPEWK